MFFFSSFVFVHPLLFSPTCFICNLLMNVIPRNEKKGNGVWWIRRLFIKTKFNERKSYWKKKTWSHRWHFEGLFLNQAENNNLQQLNFIFNDFLRIFLKHVFHILILKISVRKSLNASSLFIEHIKLWHWSFFHVTNYMRIYVLYNSYLMYYSYVQKQ